MANVHTLRRGCFVLVASSEIQPISSVCNAVIARFGLRDNAVFSMGALSFDRKGIESITLGAISSADAYKAIGSRCSGRLFGFDTDSSALKFQLGVAAEAKRI